MFVYVEMMKFEEFEWKLEKVSVIEVFVGIVEYCFVFVRVF